MLIRQTCTFHFTSPFTWVNSHSSLTLSRNRTNKLTENYTLLKAILFHFWCIKQKNAQYNNPAQLPRCKIHSLALVLCTSHGVRKAIAPINVLCASFLCKLMQIPNIIQRKRYELFSEKISGQNEQHIIQVHKKSTTKSVLFLSFIFIVKRSNYSCTFNQ